MQNSQENLDQDGSTPSQTSTPIKRAVGANKKSSESLEKISPDSQVRSQRTTSSGRSEQRAHIEIEHPVVCACGVNEVDKATVNEAGDVPKASKFRELFLTCFSCKTRQHAECFLIFAEDQVRATYLVIVPKLKKCILWKSELRSTTYLAPFPFMQMPAKHICHLCAVKREEDHLCADPIMVQRLRRGKNKEVLQTAMYRRVLNMCYKRGDSSYVTANEISNLINCPLSVAKNVVRTLVSDGLAKDPEESEDSDIMTSSQPCSAVILKLDILKNTLGPKFLGPNFEVLIGFDNQSSPSVNSLADNMARDLAVSEMLRKQPMKPRKRKAGSNEGPKPKKSGKKGWSEAETKAMNI